MATEQVAAFPFSVESVVQDVIQQHGGRLSDRDFASRKAEEASLRRYEAAGWLRKMVGVVGGKDLAAQPSEDEFKLGLRSGIILCNALNKVQPGTIPKVVEAPCDAGSISDGAALSVYQYFENVRNFLVSLEELGIPTFEASDLEQGGKTVRIVNCVLALKAYSEWKQGGGSGSWKFSAGSLKPATPAKHFIRKKLELFTSSLSRTSSSSEKSLANLSGEQSLQGDDFGDLNATGPPSSLNVLLQQILADKKQEEIPLIVQSLLTKVMEEYEDRLANQSQPIQGKSQMDGTALSTNVMDVAAESPKGMDETFESTMGMDETSGSTKARDETSESTKVMDVTPETVEVMDATPDTTEATDARPESTKVMDVTPESTRVIEATSESMKVESQEVKSHENSNIKDKHADCFRVQPLHRKLFEKQQQDIEELRQTASSAKDGMQLLQTQCMKEFCVLGQRLQDLSRAASGYRKVLEENRRLYNELQDLKGNIRVYCRVRPSTSGATNRQNVVDRIEEGNIVINTPSKYGKDARKSFTFNRVFGPSATQAEVFSDTQPLVRSVLDGYNVCIFAYGQTGSGKTHTMSGPKELTEETKGVNYRALGDLFLLSEQRKETVIYEVSVQMIEIYNEQVRDLLVTDGTIKKVEIRNTSQKGINVPDANTVPVSSSSDVMNLMNLGLRNRAVSSTAMNDRSSRSHSCLTVHVHGKELTTGNVLRGSMHLVDLAGSERVDKSEVTGDRLKEAQHINRSLSALGDVISALAQKSSHVPYRNSKLTQLLQDALGGQAKTLMFVHISPEPDALGETISTLKFAERVSTVELGAARVNKDGTDVKELKEQIAVLKAALSKKDGEASEAVHNSRFGIPESQESNPALTLHNSWSGTDLDSLINHRQPMEDADNIQNNSASMLKPKRRSLDITDMLANSPPWTNSASSPSLSSKEDDKESVIGEWVDKVMVKKHDGESRGDIPHGWEANSSELLNGFFQRCHSDPLMIYPELPSTNSAPRSLPNDEVEDMEVATHDSSETDLRWQYNPSKLPKNAAGATKQKKPNAKNGKNPEMRSMIPAPAVNPSASRKLANGQSNKSKLPAPGRRNGNMK
ncbi:hypothetical protein MLD38_010539 [Melastoma candidum]|uniref:Uncharacterized protein n=1 Tax=Melastoma candidum TaxID=119954 RepID=A0ACB9R8J0_9MYRT|nr:hypothetical protein MLD38_010539 [Melastoma candidum]